MWYTSTPLSKFGYWRKVKFEWKIHHFVKVLSLAKVWNCVDYCLSLTQDSHSESDEWVNFIENPDISHEAHKHLELIQKMLAPKDNSKGLLYKLYLASIYQVIWVKLTYHMF